MKLPQIPTHVFVSSLCSLGCTPHADAQREPSQVGVVGLPPACGPGQKGGGGSPLLALCVTGALRQFMVISLLLKQVQQHENEYVITLIHPGGVVEWHPSSYTCSGPRLRLAWCWRVEDSQGIDLLLSYSRQRWAKAAGVVCISQ